MSEAVLRGWAIPERGATPYPERRDVEEWWLDRALGNVYGRIAPRITRPGRAMARFADQVDGLSVFTARYTEAEIRQAADALRGKLRGAGFTDELLAEAFALVREVSHRLIDLRHFRCQLMGGWAMAHGMLAEMQTGEGKTITAALPAAAVALAGLPVHVITVNDYLAGRDAAQLRPVFEALGLTVGLVQHGQDPDAKRAAYGCDVVYCTNKDLAFDYLRDRITLAGQQSEARLRLRAALAGRAVLPSLLLRGLVFGIVDEADSVLIDEARTPLIISGSDEAGDAALYEQALEIARALVPRRDYHIAAGDRLISLTDVGRGRLGELSEGLEGLWPITRAREELAVQALSALHLFQRDRNYIVRDDRVQIVDEYTGRVMEDRSWERGLHQMIEVKEGCPVTGQRRTLSRITYQRLFRRYLRLAGMSGTAAEVAGEMWEIYGLKVVRIPTNRPVRRSDRGIRIYPAAEERWQHVVQAVQRERAAGRPVLVGTRSVAASEHLSSRLTRAGIDHAVLNARQDESEAETIMGAGLPARVTVATNMAGRGTDIRLGEGVADRGGLHVILTEFHEAKRIDRQLFGRCGRQGDPGSYEALASLDDDLFTHFASRFTRFLRRRLAGRVGPLPGWLASLARGRAQAAAERSHSAVRRLTLKQDQELEQRLAFSGKGE